MKSIRIFNFNIFLLAVIILIVGILFIGHYYMENQHIKKLLDENIELEYKIALKNEKIEIISQKILYQYENEDVVLNSNIKIKDDTEEFYLKNLIEQKEYPTIIFRYSELQCQDCVDEQVKMLKRIGKEIGSEKIIILANYRQSKYLALFKRMNQLTDIKVFQVDSLNIPLEQLDMPYLFVLDKNMTTHFFFIPDKELPEIYQNYYEIVKNKFFKSSNK